MLNDLVKKIERFNFIESLPLYINLKPKGMKKSIVSVILIFCVFLSFSQVVKKDAMNTKQKVVTQHKVIKAPVNENNATVTTGKPIKLQSKMSENYAGVLNGSKDNGAAIILWTDNKQPDAIWTIQANSHNTKTNQHYYDLQNKHSQKYLSADKDNSSINQWDSSIKDFRLWEILSASDGYVKLKNKSTGKYLGVNGKEAGSKLVQLDENAKDEILWKPIE